jgi:type II secretory pathway component GspD/PulD (secretin)
MKTMQTYLTCALLGAVSLKVSAAPLDTSKKVSLDLMGVPLVQVIDALAQQNQFNVVYAGKINGTVTIHLENVDLPSALSSVLMANGYTYVLKDDIVIVKETESEMPGDLTTQAFRLSYADPEAVVKAVISVLSPRGKAVVLKPDVSAAGATARGTTATFRANAIVVTDFAGVINDVARLVKQLDVQERTLLIEAKIIETSLNSDDRLGLAWPSAIGLRATGITDVVTNKNVGGINLDGGRWTWGTLSAQQLDATLNFLQSNGNSKLLSDPRITATENHEAEIKIATVIPIQTLSRFTEGAATQDIVTFEDEEIGISLKVTARINAEGTITLDVSPRVEDIIGYTGPADNQRPIKTTRTITTRVTVKDGETVVLGGLLKDDIQKNQQRFPLLGHLPVVGKALFTSTTTKKSSTDLVLFITPKIVE